VLGLPWFKETSPDLVRLPCRLEHVLRPGLWELARCPSGGRLRFATDSEFLAVRVRFGELGFMPNMPRLAQAGLDLYVDQRYYRTVYPAQAGESMLTLAESLPRQPGLRVVDVYLPLYQPVDLLAMRLSADAHVALCPPLLRCAPVVFYGSSITQGACASRPGLAYPALIGRQLGIDHVNLGFSGQGKGDLPVAEAIAEIDAAAVVLDYGVNCESAIALRAVYGCFLRTLRAARPRLPIVCVTPLYSARERWSDPDRSRLEGLRAVVREAVERERTFGVGPLELVEGESLLGTDDEDGLADASHPNDLGFTRIAERLAPTIARYVALSG